VLAARVRQQRATGRDPGDEYKKEKARRLAEATVRAASTFGAAVRAYVEDHAKPNTRRWRETAGILGMRPGEQGLEEIKGGLAQRWRDKPLAEIPAQDVRALLAETRRAIPGRKARPGRGAASRRRSLHAALSAFFSWATADFDVPDNPCENLGRKAPKARERKLTDDELQVFWKACDQLGQPFGPLFQLLLLTGQRRDEVARMTRDELSKDSETWSLPGSRTKNRREHAVPMSPAARELIRGMRRIAACEYIFSTNGRTPVSGFSKAKRQLDAEMADLADGATIPAWRLHDLRRTCASGMAELGVPLQVTEKVLNHVSGSLGGIVSVYQVHDYLKERRDALERWAEHVQKIIAGD
jgi:integrase